MPDRASGAPAGRRDAGGLPLRRDAAGGSRRFTAWLIGTRLPRRAGLSHALEHPAGGTLLQVVIFEGQPPARMRSNLIYHNRLILWPNWLQSCFGEGTRPTSWPGSVVADYRWRMYRLIGSATAAAFLATASLAAQTDQRSLTSAVGQALPVGGRYRRRKLPLCRDI